MSEGSHHILTVNGGSSSLKLERAAPLIRQLDEKLVQHRAYITEHGIDMPEVCHWRWSARP